MFALTPTGRRFGCGVATKLCVPLVALRLGARAGVRYSQGAGSLFLPGFRIGVWGMAPIPIRPGVELLLTPGADLGPVRPLPVDEHHQVPPLTEVSEGRHAFRMIGETPAHVLEIVGGGYQGHIQFMFL